MNSRKSAGPPHGRRAADEQASPSHDPDLTSDQSFPGSDPAGTWSSAGRDDPAPLPGDDPAPMSPPRRRRLVHRVTLIWVGVLVVALAMVVTAIVGLSTDEGERAVGTVVFVILGVLGAALAAISTLWRAKAGDSLDEARLD